MTSKNPNTPSNLPELETKADSMMQMWTGATNLTSAERMQLFVEEFSRLDKSEQRGVLEIIMSRSNDTKIHETCELLKEGLTEDKGQTAAHQSVASVFGDSVREQVHATTKEDEIPIDYDPQVITAMRKSARRSGGHISVLLVPYINKRIREDIENQRTRALKTLNKLEPVIENSSELARKAAQIAEQLRNHGLDKELNEFSKYLEALTKFKLRLKIQQASIDKAIKGLNGYIECDNLTIFEDSLEKLTEKIRETEELLANDDTQSQIIRQTDIAKRAIQTEKDERRKKFKKAIEATSFEIIKSDRKATDIYNHAGTLLEWCNENGFESQAKVMRKMRSVYGKIRNDIHRIKESLHEVEKNLDDPKSLEIFKQCQSDLEYQKERIARFLEEKKATETAMEINGQLIGVQEEVETTIQKLRDAIDNSTSVLRKLRESKVRERLVTELGKVDDSRHLALVKDEVSEERKADFKRLREIENQMTKLENIKNPDKFTDAKEALLEQISDTKEFLGNSEATKTYELNKLIDYTEEMIVREKQSLADRKKWEQNRKKRRKERREKRMQELQGQLGTMRSNIANAIMAAAIAVGGVTAITSNGKDPEEAVARAQEEFATAHEEAAISAEGTGTGLVTTARAEDIVQEIADEQLLELPELPEPQAHVSRADISTIDHPEVYTDASVSEILEIDGQTVIQVRSALRGQAGLVRVATHVDGDRDNLKIRDAEGNDTRQRLTPGELAHITGETRVFEVESDGRTVLMEYLELENGNYIASAHAHWVEQHTQIDLDQYLDVLIENGEHTSKEQIHGEELSEEDIDTDLTPVELATAHGLQPETIQVSPPEVEGIYEMMFEDSQQKIRYEWEYLQNKLDKATPPPIPMDALGAVEIQTTPPPIPVAARRTKATPPPIPNAAFNKRVRDFSKSRSIKDILEKRIWEKENLVTELSDDDIEPVTLVEAFNNRLGIFTNRRDFSDARVDLRRTLRRMRDEKIMPPVPTVEDLTDELVEDVTDEAVEVRITPPPIPAKARRAKATPPAIPTKEKTAEKPSLFQRAKSFFGFGSRAA